MARQYLSLKLVSHELNELDLTVVLSCNLNEEEKTITLYDFVPEDYNVMEKTTGWDTPDFIEYKNEDYTPQNWLDSHKTKELHRLIINTIWDEL